MRKTIKNVIFTLLLLTLGMSTAFLAYLHFFASDDKDLTGEWTAKLDVTDQAAVIAYSWLQDIEAVSVSLEDIDSYMQGLTIQVNLTFEQTARSEGTFSCNISKEGYEVCSQAAYEAFALAFQDLLSERLHMAGYTGSTDEEAVEKLITETFGMDTVSYLMSYGPKLLPSLEELQAEYDGSGTYQTEEDILIRQYDGVAAITRAERFIRQDSDLILSEDAGSDSGGLLSDYYPIIYILEQSPNQ